MGFVLGLGRGGGGLGFVMGLGSGGGGLGFVLGLGKRRRRRKVGIGICGGSR
ncbi:hypothetical protein GCM10010495_81740 [Kitasatospora herbaricolor]|nr:hypothetical protein GCM10010252_77940 [Streptomyces aureoverticillatus]GGV51969.1 hypothetical protein GCM10010495_81740 [Kitasatospora herbaricolor]